MFGTNIYSLSLYGLDFYGGSMTLTNTQWQEALVQLANANQDSVTLLASAAQTATQTIDNIKAPIGARGVIVVVDTTVVPGSAPSNVVTINAKDPVSGKVSTLLTSAAIAAVGTKFLTCYPGATAASNVTVSFPITPTYQVVVTAGNANSATYGVTAIYLV